jgi:alpha,alpha-trehalase
MYPAHIPHRVIRGQMLALTLVALIGCATTAPQQTLPRTPIELYGDLFREVQMARVFPDGKTFVDVVAKRDPKEIVAAYEREKNSPGFDLKAFVEREFSVPVVAPSEYRSIPGENVTEHIDRLWPVMTRDPAVEIEYSSRLPLPERYVVPGGRFNEMYYWDSYFTMLGLQASGRHDLVKSMCDNFAVLIQRYGHIPNGNRSYYLSRSQPPFFAAMIELLAKHEGAGTYAQYRDALQKEYDFWMEGAQQLQPGHAHRRVVRLKDGTILNRYWDDRATPREESFREDVNTARDSGRPAEEVYRNLRAAAESGWDFSSRWFEDGKSLSTIRTVELIPVDLNSLLFQLEQTLSRAYESSDAARSNEFRSRANDRRAAIQRVLWDSKLGTFTDYVWQQEVSAKQVTAATVVPLFFGIASVDQASAVAETVPATLLSKYGIVTTMNRTGQQWDSPNGWAPHQWMAVDGFRRYGYQPLAKDIAARWIKQNLAVFEATGKLVEKYDVVTGGGEAGGGEYPLQDGFGWTNGVLRALLVQYPELGR